MCISQAATQGICLRIWAGNLKRVCPELQPPWHRLLQYHAWRCPTRHARVCARIADPRGCRQGRLVADADRKAARRGIGAYGGRSCSRSFGS